MALGAAWQPELTRAVYRMMGADLRGLGINLDFAPVADVNTNPENPVIGLRSFGDDPARVGAHVAAAIDGLHAAGIASAAKHFPGHGDTSADSHLAPVATTRDAAHLRRVELAPFRAAIDARVDLIMTGHVSAPALDPSGAPATLSKALVQGVLRDELGFNGVVCTDDMVMAGIASRYSIAQASVLAIDAGADLLVFSELDAAREGLDALRAAVRDGRLKPDRVAASLARVETLRWRTAQRVPDEDAPPIDSATLTRDVAQRSVCVVRASVGIPPLSLPAGARVFVVNFIEGGPAKSTGARVESVLGKMLAAAGLHVSEQLRDLEPAGHEYKQLLMAAGNADAFVAVTRRAFVHRLQAQAVVDLALFGKPIVAIAALEPYDATHLPDGVAVIATFGDGDDELAAAGAVLLGTAPALGRLPVVLGASPQVAGTS
jgi:beta-N-acetylhexosaminidase